MRWVAETNLTTFFGCIIEFPFLYENRKKTILPTKSKLLKNEIGRYLFDTFKLSTRISFKAEPAFAYQ